ncbi:MAG: LacI family DNA-binding transcriptional regulator [Thermomicrobiales bacterium]
MSLRDVGLRAGVSFQTVSKVLRGKGSVADTTRERVLAAAAELGYVPNSLARGLATSETHSIGFIASGLASFVLAPLLRGAEREARRHGYFVLFTFVDDQPGEGERVLRQLIERRVDGIISAALALRNDAVYGGLLRDATRSVAMHTIPDGGVPIVGEDSEQPGFLGTTHLVAGEHRRIATIADAWDGVSVRGRLAGYVKALEDAGIPFDPQLVATGGWTIEGGYHAMNSLLNKQLGITAVFAHNDHMAMGALRALQERGCQVPRDISVVGCDDVDFASFTTPPLTTVRLSFESTGVAAVRLLIDLLQDGEVIPEHIMLPCSLVARQSTRKLEEAV